MTTTNVCIPEASKQTFSEKNYGIYVSFIFSRLLVAANPFFEQTPSGLVVALPRLWQPEVLGWMMAAGSAMQLLGPSVSGLTYGFAAWKDDLPVIPRVYTTAPAGGVCLFACSCLFV